MKIAIVVHGRFHAFDLTRELLKRRHEVTLFTNYPKWEVKRFGIPYDRTCSFWQHSVLFRIFWFLHEKVGFPFPEPFLHKMFGRWAANQIRKESWDIVLCWSGIGEETFHALNGARTLKICHRSSSHIRVQARILKMEQIRTGISLEMPNSCMVAREEREYDLANMILVPSTFVKQTFLTEGILSEKIWTIPLGVNTKAFHPTQTVIENRCARILSGNPLQVLNVGTFSLRKGMWDMGEVIKGLNSDNFRFRFIGPIASEASTLIPSLCSRADFLPKQPQEKLSMHYEWGDVFMLPTIEDGFPMVLPQAAAASLPILTTPNGAGTDLIQEGNTGWVLPIRSPEAFIERLRWCDTHRTELAQMVQRIYEEFRPRDWSEVAKDFESICEKLVKNKNQERLRDGIG